MASHDKGILRSLLRQLEFLHGEDETANCIAKDTLHNEYVSVITSFDF